MQTIQFIQTARWIKNQFSEECYNLLFEGMLFGGPPSERSKEPQESLLMVTHEITAVWPVLTSNALAVKLLHEFGLDELLSGSMAVRMAQYIISKKEGQDVQRWGYSIERKWTILNGCLEPLERLTTPVVVSKEKDFDEIFTIELRPKEDINPPVRVISEILTVANGIYDDMCKLMCIKDKKNLTVLYSTSGSSFRFDFTGSGEPIEQLKKLIVELWNKYRYSDADKLRNNITTAATGLKLMQDIKDKRDKKVINDENANLLTGKIMVGISNLFQNGATIREIDSVVTVSNQNLLEKISEKKLLPKPITPEVEKKPKKKAKKAKKAKEGQQNK